jgi:predicted porin
MKTPLIAMVALVAGSSFAQSTVTISGLIELAAVKPVGAAGVRLDAPNSNNNLTFRGSEDLGGGLKANFTLSQRFSPESGGNDGSKNGRPTFNGESTVGLSGAFGSTKIGRGLTAMQSVVVVTDIFTANQVAASIPPALIGRYATAPEDTRDGAGLARTDGIWYSSPSFGGGFSVSGTYGLKNSAATGVSYTGKNALTSLALTYAAGPVRADVAWEKNRAGDTVGWVAGSYNFGVAKVVAGYGVYDPDASAVDQKNYHVGVAVPIGAATLKAQYGQSKPDNGAAFMKRLGVGADYALSKRTSLYVTLGHEKGTMVATERSGYALGIRHAF